MNTKSKKYIALFMGLLMLITSGITNHNNLNAEVINDQSSNEETLSKLEKTLNANKHWIKIKKYWKELNAVENQHEYNANYKMFQNLFNQTNDITISINLIQDSGILTKKQARYLNNLIKDRAGYLEYHIGFVECYKMSELGFQITQTRGDLEKRYDTLENLFKENKIDQKTFSLTKNKIIEDIKFIDDNSNYEPKTQADKTIIDLMILLNK